MNVSKILKVILTVMILLVLIVTGVLTYLWINGQDDDNSASKQVSQKMNGNETDESQKDEADKTEEKNDDHQKEDESKDKAIRNEDGEKNTLYDEVEVQMDVIDEHNIHASYQYPLFHDDGINKVILQFIKEQKMLFEQESTRMEKANQISTHNVNFKLDKLSENLYTLVFENTMNVSGANGYVQYKTWIIDNKNYNVFTFKDFIINEPKAHDILYKVISAEIKKDKDKDFYVDYPTLKDYIQNNQLRAYPKGEKIVFNFNEYDVAAGALGAFSLEVSTEKIKDSLTDEGKVILIDQDLTKLTDKQLAQIRVDTPEHIDVPKTEEDHTYTEAPSSEDTQQENNTKNNEKPTNQVVDKGVPKTKKIAVTFDDGPNGSTTPHVLEILDKFNAKATFYMIGSKVKYNQNIVRQVHERGHQIGNHTMNHPDLTTLGQSQIKQEFDETNDLIQQAIGEKPSTFRPPYGSTNASVNQMTDMKPVLWTIDTEDWKSHDPQAILEVVKANHQDGGIVLMHDIHKTTVDSLVDVLTFLSNEGYEFVTVDEVM